MNELDLFAAAIGVADPGERAALLERECAGRPDLRQRLDQLLAAHFRPNALLDQAEPEHSHTLDAPGSTTGSIPTAAEAVGTVIAGRYKLLQQIGEGGMGSVWMADQTEPVKRRVAVKLIRVERGQSRMILSRFEAERQAIALMDHPNIARLLDAGTTDVGSPFFVMELVKGIALNEYCDTHKLSIRDRLQLFIEVCSTVQHAHQKGVIHRDLKPTNILVESHDGKAVPKVIDFGLAKATTGLQLSEHTLFTALGSVIGTPLYMAPEQANFNAVDVDTRADVYALGVILFELLTGTTPITQEALKKAALDEMLKLIREQDAPTPSSRLSTIESMPSIAANRQSEPQKLSRLVKGELDWIVMKALSKERDRRYETASGFARDIERFLNHDAVAAGPPSASYKLRKFVRRNRVQATAASLVLLALVAGVVGTSLGLLEARRQAELARGKALEANEEKGRALLAAQEERKAKLEADQKRQEAERNLAFAKKGNEILGSVFAGLDPKRIAESGRPLQDVLRQNLNTAVKELEGSAIGDPLEVAAMQGTLAQSLSGLGEAALAGEVFQKALGTRQARLGPDNPLTLASMNDLAVAYRESGQHAKALPLIEETLEKDKAKLGPDHPDTLTAMDNLARTYHAAGQLTKAVALFQQTLERRKAKLGPNHPSTLITMSTLAGAYMDGGQLAEALPMFEGVLDKQKAKLGPDHPDTLAAMNNLALAYQASGRLSSAVALYEETLERKKTALGPAHPDTLTAVNNLALAYDASGQVAKALPLFEDTLKQKKATLGPDHPGTLASMNNLAAAYQSSGQISRAIQLFEESLEKLRSKLGPDHPYTLGAMNNLADAYRASGQLARAVSLFEETLEKMKAKLGTDHPDTLTTMNNLALAYEASGQSANAVRLFEHTLEKRKAKLGPDHPDALNSLMNLGFAYQKNGRLAEAVALLEETLEKAKSKLGPDHPATIATMNNLALAYGESGQLAKAARLLEETLEKAKSKLGPDHPDTLSSMKSLAGVYQSSGQLAKAVALYEDFLEKKKAKLGPDHADTLAAMTALAEAYQSSGQPAKAVPLLQYSLHKVKAKLGPEHPDTLAIMANLGKAYAGTKHGEKAAAVLSLFVDGSRKQLPKDSPQFAGLLAQVSQQLLDCGEYAAAVPLFRECLAIREKTEPDDLLTFNTQSILGAALLAQKKYAETEPLLVKGYEGMKAREKTTMQIHGGELRIPEALDRLIALYTAAAKPEEAKKYRELRAKYPETKPADRK